MSELPVRKVCLIGDFAVGKTSLTRRFISQHFSDRYLTTVGVKVEVRVVTVAQGKQVKLVVWDIAGSDHLSALSATYLNGAHGVIYVADGTRPETLETAQALIPQVEAKVGKLPWQGLVNKVDLAGEWVVPDAFFAGQGQWHPSSALSGEGVDEAFLRLAESLLA